MTHEEIRARLAEIEHDLFAPAGYGNTQISAGLDAMGQLKYGPYLKSLPAQLRPSELGRLVAEQNVQRQLQHETHFETLRKERESLLAQLPKTGEACGHLVMTGHFLRGTTIVREAPPEEPRDDGYDRSDPYQRFARECGWPND
jgi:hypothetical protein